MNLVTSLTLEQLIVLGTFSLANVDFIGLNLLNQTWLGHGVNVKYVYVHLISENPLACR